MRRKWKILTFTSLSVIFLDQLTKYIISRTMYLGQSIKVINPFFSITYIKNPNAAFGISVGPPILIMILTSVATILLTVYFFRLREKGLLIYLGLAMIIGGAIGNLIDRLRMRQVIDFIEIGVRKFKWPVFNIADSFVTIGIIAILWVWIFVKNKKENEDSLLTNP